MTARPPNTEEEREDQPLTLSRTGSPKLDKGSQPSLFPKFKTLGKRTFGKPPKATRRMHR